MTQNTIQPSRLRPLRRMSAIIFSAATALALVSCSNDGTTTDPSTPTLTTTQTAQPPPPTDTSSPDLTLTTTMADTTSDSPVPTTTGPSPLGQPSLNDQQVMPENAQDDLLVTGVRVATHDTFDRVVFDFSGGGRPGWFTSYTDTPHQQGSGFPVEVAGSSALMVGIEGTAYPPPSGAPVLGTVQGAGGNVREVVYTSIFEGRTEYFVGVDSRQPYSVTVLEEPTRLVVDILKP